MRTLVILLVGFWASHSLYSATNTAASASRADVQTAVAAASSGDTILIPNGTASWTSGIDSGTKQLIIRAQNYTPTSQPTSNTTRNVVITYSGTTQHAIKMVTGDTYHCGVGGIKFLTSVVDEEGGAPNIWGFVSFSGSGTKPPLLFDCWFVGNDRESVTASEAAFLSISSLGGIVWNCYFDGTRVPDGTSVAYKGMGGAGIHVTSPRAWTTASTMGALDTGGNVNVYFEDCRLLIWGQCDVDNNGRVVFRYSTIDGQGWQTHGFSSDTGGRHVEIYNSDCVNTIMDRNSNQYFWLRGGTCLIADSFLSDEETGYGPMSALAIGDNEAPGGSYPLDRGPGRGHNGTSHVGDPMYLWGNTGGSAYDWWVNTDWDSHVDLDRDIYVNSGAKPSYSKYTYPHPMRVDGGGETPAAPRRLRVTEARVGTIRAP